MPEKKTQSELMSQYFRQGTMPTTWCAGCGIGTIMGSVVRAIDASGVPRHRFVFVTGIGCYGPAGQYIKVSDLHALHGRTPAYATGLKLANPEVYPILLMGDGDAASIGGNHLIHAARRNIDVTALVMNNHNYGMTGGQYSPTTPKNVPAATAPYGMVERSFDLCRMVEAAGATFVARTTVYHVTQMVKLLTEAILHKGFSFVEIESQCPTYFGRSSKIGSAVNMLKRQKESSIPVEKARGMKPEELEGKIVTGVLVREERPEYGEEYRALIARVQGKEGKS
ncbi:MAG TPA: 2-oxoacid:ferredoxin oxidoreductase subunit beta [Thermodesulfobacteriota bacterium]|nr:2-oxoacid:ferredoxin oxidoreductase subunit beta [Thermodesulfobacteriota bacterium]